MSTSQTLLKCLSPLLPTLGLKYIFHYNSLNAGLCPFMLLSAAISNLTVVFIGQHLLYAQHFQVLE